MTDQEAQRGRPDWAEPHLVALASLDNQGLDPLFLWGNVLQYVDLEIIKLCPCVPRTLFNSYNSHIYFLNAKILVILLLQKRELIPREGLLWLHRAMRGHIGAVYRTRICPRMLFLFFFDNLFF